MRLPSKVTRALLAVAAVLGAAPAAVAGTSTTLCYRSGNIGVFDANQTCVPFGTITGGAFTLYGLGTGVSSALAANVGSAGAVVVNGGALGTPSSATLTNATGLPIAGITGLGTGVAAALATNTGSAGAPALVNGALGTPSSATLTNATGLPVAGVTGLGTGVAAALANTANGASGVAVLNADKGLTLSTTGAAGTNGAIFSMSGSPDVGGNANWYNLKDNLGATLLSTRWTSYGAQETIWSDYFGFRMLSKTTGYGLLVGLEAGNDDSLVVMNSKENTVTQFVVQPNGSPATTVWANIALNRVAGANEEHLNFLSTLAGDYEVGQIVTGSGAYHNLKFGKVAGVPAFTLDTNNNLTVQTKQCVNCAAGASPYTSFEVMDDITASRLSAGSDRGFRIRSTVAGQEWSMSLSEASAHWYLYDRTNGKFPIDIANNVNTAISLGSGGLSVTGGSIAAGTYLKATPTTFASGLGGSSTCSDKGRIWAVTDGAAALAWGANISGGGSAYYTINCNGSNWTVMGK